VGANGVPAEVSMVTKVATLADHAPHRRHLANLSFATISYHSATHLTGHSIINGPRISAG